MKSSPNTCRRSVLVALALSTFVMPSGVAALQGFDYVLGRVARAPDKPIGSAEAFYAKRDAFVAESEKLAPSEAAKRWLALVDAALAIPRRDWYGVQSARGEERGLSCVLSALPSPAAWDDIIKGIREKSAPGNSGLALRLTAAGLSGDIALRAEALAALRAEMKKGGNPRADRGRRPFFGRLLTTLQDPDSPEARDDAIADWNAKFVETGNEFGGDYLNLNEIPDLVALFGPDKAEVEMRRALARSQSFWNVKGCKTRSLLAKVALSLVPELKKPCWRAVEYADSPALFDALRKKFPRSPDAEQDYAYTSAVSRQLAILLRAGSTDTSSALAIAVYKETGETPSVGDYHARSPAAALAEHYAKVIAADPLVPVYSEFITAMAVAGRSEEALKTIKAIAARKDLSEASRIALDAKETKALLAAGKSDEAASRLLAIIAEPVPKKVASGTSRTARALADSRSSRRTEALHTLSELGRLEKHPEWSAAAVAAMRSDVASRLAERDFDNTATALLDVLLKENRWDDVEGLVGDLVEAMGKPASGNEWRRSGVLDGAMMTLVKSYSRAGRPSDAIAVLEKWPQWNSADIKSLSIGYGSGRIPLAEIASALLAEGRREDALRVLDHALAVAPGDDAAYALALKLDGNGDAFLARMDTIFAGDRFEERPLIWKAKALYELGRYDEALAVAKSAVEIDPSDGEQGKGDRMRVYAVLADILEKKGDVETAKVYRGAVSAIRLSEDADDYYAAGLLSKAISMYEESLTRFADAYCIQSRLAVRYAEAGDMTNATKHYTRAFELMPDSFGRIESHCFGCEGAFEGEVAQGVAEKVFSGIIAKKPENSRAQYLLGYLREEQGRFADAAGFYRRAASIDPDYYNAWSKLRSLRDNEEVLKPGEYALCSQNLFRLRPRSAGSEELNAVGDLRLIWNTLATVVPKETPGFVLPLKAAAERMKQRQPQNGFYPGMGIRDSLSPRKAVAGTPFLLAAAQIADMGDED